jgi:hypothetical protein
MDFSLSSEEGRSVAVEGRRKHLNELEIPPQAVSDPKAVEIARIWAAGGNQIVTFRAELWSDPSTWGIMLVDFVRHLGDAYQQAGNGTKNDIMRVIRLAFDIEWKAPTDHQAGSA